MSNDWNPDQSELAAILVNLNTSCSESQLQTLKVVLSPLGIDFTCLEECNSFSDVYRLIEQKVPNQAVSLVIEVLRRIGIPKNDLKPLHTFVQHVFTPKDKPIMDLVLTLGEILMNMTSEIYGDFKELVRSSFLPKFHPDRLSCCAKLLETLLSRNFISVHYLNRYFEWIDGAGCSYQLETLRRFCARHGIEEPYWQPKTARPHTFSDQSSIANISVAPIECTDDGPFGAQMNLPSSVSQDGGASQSMRNPTLTVADNQHTQAPPPHHAGHVSSDNPEQRRLLSEPKSSSCVPSDQTQSTPVDINPNPSSGSNARRSEYQHTQDHRREEVERIYRRLTKGEWCCFTSLFIPATILLIVSFICFLLWILYSSHNHILVDTPKPTVEYVGSNTTILLGCFDTSVTKNVHVVEASTHINANYNAKLYKVTKSNLRTKSILLSNHHRTFEEDSDQNVAVNYLYGDDPVYVASRGNLEFKITAKTHLSSPTCLFQFFLFLIPKNYHMFLDSDDALPAHYSQKSDCFTVGTSIGEVIAFNFTLPSPGLYYIAAHIKEYVEVNITIRGSVTSYDTSDIPDEDCSLNSGNHRCTIDINPVEVPGIHVPQHHKCILAKSSVEENNKVNITRVNMDWNVGSVLSFTPAIICCLIGLILLVISCVYYYVRTRVRTRRGYRKLENH